MTTFINNNLSPKTIDYEYYPQDRSSKDVLYYIEFVKYDRQYFKFGGTSTSSPTVYSGWGWALYKRSFFFDVPDDSLMPQEVHPYKLHSGIVNEDPNAVDLQTRKYLQFMVDAMNEKAKTSNP